MKTTNLENTKQKAKQVDMVGYLSKMGHQPTFNNEYQAKYISPIRSAERTASFVVYRDGNRFYDFGSGEGGDIIDLCQRLEGKSFKDAVDSLAGHSFVPSIPARSLQQSIRRNSKKKSGIKLLGYGLLKNRKLKEYLLERGITARVAENYLHEVYYEVNGRNYYALGLINEKGGYATRNFIHKYAINPAYFSWIPKEGSRSLVVFEGFMDALSFIEYHRFGTFKSNVIVLNSTTNTEKAIDMMHGYDPIDLYLDNDAAGEKAVALIQQNFPHARDCSKTLYPGFNDLNDFWMDNIRKSNEVNLN